MLLPKIISQDSFLLPFKNKIIKRNKLFVEKEREFLGSNNSSLSDFANGYNYFGCFTEGNKIVFREWLPNAKEVYLVGDFNDWTTEGNYKFEKQDNGVFVLELQNSSIKHCSLYKLFVKWESGEGERVSAWAKRVVQDENTKLFSAQVWHPNQNYDWKYKTIESNEPLFIYEAHIGMAGEEEKVSSFTYFKNNVLPRVIKLGYNTIQLMAIQEHPYYGSFGYHVSSYFAVSSRFGTPEDLKELIDEAHKNKVRVVMDIVHSHAVKNEIEGLGNYDGTRYQFFHDGGRGLHPAWDSFCFNYGKNEVLHFLLSNIKYWMQEFNFDGFRFDGVTSMIYFDHGLDRDFSSYDDYFNGTQDEDALTYLMLANKLMHEINPNSVSIAEEMSGYPGLASKIEDGGIGFDYRLAMGIPDFWIKTLKEKEDKDWEMGKIYHELTAKRDDEKTVSYTESHDQALVGDKTIAFRLMDKEMYFHMLEHDSNIKIDRGIALHKIIRLLTLATSGGGYLNFMGNEFGHPEWIDFPREGNNWSYKYAVRQWSLVDRNDLKYKYLNAFDEAMVHLIKQKEIINIFPFYAQKIDEKDKIIAFARSNLIFVFNFNPTDSFTDYGIPVPNGRYKYLMGTDELRFGGFARVDETQRFYSELIEPEGTKQQIKMYLPSRTAIILEKQDTPNVHQKLKTK